MASTDIIKNSRSWLAGFALLAAGCICTVTASARDDYKSDPLANSSAAPASHQVASTVPVPAAPATTAPAPSAVGDSAAESNAGVVVFHIGDPLTVAFPDSPSSDMKPIDTKVADDGTITLMFNQKVVAVGKTERQLASDIRAIYVPAYYKNMTPIVTTRDRYYTVGGEVKHPDREVYSTKMTLLGAIDTAGGYGDFANKKKIRVTRANGQIIMVNGKEALDHPEKNIEIFPGDQIHVYKRIW